MKFTVNVECSPEEARRFLGWPDVGEMQKQMIEAMQQKMQDGLTDMDAEKLMQMWLPMGLQAAENWQKMFFSHLSSMAGGSSDNSDH